MMIHKLSLLTVALAGLVPLTGIGSLLKTDTIHSTHFPADRAHQAAQTSPHRYEPTIVLQFTAGSTNDNTTNPAETAQSQSSTSNDNSADSEEPKLVDMVANYLKSTAAENRVELGTRIRQKASNRIVDVAQAMQEVQVWDENVPAAGRFDFSDQPRIATDFVYQLPSSYDPKKPHSLVVKFSENPLRSTPTLSPILDSVMSDAIVLTPKNVLCTKCPLDFRRVLRTARVKLHIDSSRVFLAGVNQGADAAWDLAVSFDDMFAGVSAVTGYLDVPLRKQMYALMLPNMHSMKGVSACMIDGAPEGTEAYVHDLWCRALAKTGTDQKLSIRFFTGGYELNDVFQAYDVFKDARRPTIPTKLSHYFRYPEQGQCAWLRQTKFAGEVWTAEQLSILPGPDVDADQYITDVLKSLLAYMGGTIEGNTIRIETRRCADIELLLYENMVDFTKPVVVYINGKKRHDRVVKPSISTLLEEAYDTFDFQRLVFARLAFDIKEDSTTPTSK